MAGLAEAVIRTPRLGEKVSYTFLRSAQESISFLVTAVPPGANGTLEIEYDHAIPGSMSHQGKVVFNSSTGLPLLITARSASSEFGVEAYSLPDVWFVYRGIVQNQFEWSAYYFNAETYQIPLQPLIPFLFWNSTRGQGLALVRDLFGFPSSASIRSHPDADGLYLTISAPQYDEVGLAFVARNYTFKFRPDSAFPEIVFGHSNGQAQQVSMRASWLSSGLDAAPWNTGPPPGRDAGCDMETGGFRLHVPDGSSAGHPFPLRAAVEAAGRTLSWKRYLDEHPDAYVYEAHFRDYSNSSDPSVVPRLSWILHLGRPNDQVATGRKFAGFEVWQVGAAPATAVAVAREFEGLLGPLPAIPVELAVPTVGGVYEFLASQHPDDRIELSVKTTLHPSAYRLVQVSGFVHDGGAGPVEYHYGGYGCLLEKGRYKQAQID